MPSNTLLEDFAQSPAALDRWMFAHQREHEKIVDALQKKYTGLKLRKYCLYPFTDKLQAKWIQDNQQAHNDANGYLSIGGSDLQDVHFEDDEARERWIRLHWQEHVTIGIALGV